MLKIKLEAASEEELLILMEKKVQSSRFLKEALAERDSLKQALLGIEVRIDQLTKDAAVEFVSEDRGPILR